MAKSLQEQLLASGVAKPKQAKKARREKVRRDQAARREGKTPEQEAALAAEIARSEADKRERDRALNASQKAERQARERDQSASQIIDQHRIKAGGKGENIAYSYTVAGKVRRVEVSPGQQRDLAAGRLAIVRHRNTTSLLPRSAAERLPESMADAIWLLSREEEIAADPDDPYAAFQVPDDLMW